MKVKVLILLLFVWISSFAQIKVACVGNSITFGVGGETSSYPQQLGKILGKDWTVKNFGVSGATMLKRGDFSYWNQPEFNNAIEFMPDVVIIKLGTNDSKPQNWDRFKDDYAKDYNEMINIFRNLNSHPVIWLGLPAPVVRNRWGIRKSIVEKDMQTIIKQLAQKNKLGLIDFFTVLDGKPELLPDGIHPDSTGYKLMAEKAAKILKKNKKKIKKR